MAENKEAHDMSIYISSEALPYRDALKDVLIDIDSNISMLLSDLIPSALTHAKKVRDKGGYHRQYVWTVTAKLKAQYRKGKKK